MENFPWHDLLADVGIISAILLSFWGFYRKIRDSRDDEIQRLTSIEQRLTVVESRLTDCHIELTNHIPTKIDALDHRIDELTTALVAHEAREAVYWKLVERHLKGD